MLCACVCVLLGRETSKGITASNVSFGRSDLCGCVKCAGATFAIAGG